MWKDCTLNNIRKNIEDTRKRIENKKVEPSNIFLRVPVGIKDLKIFEPISDNHPLLKKLNLVGEWYPVALYGSIKNNGTCEIDNFGPPSTDTTKNWYKIILYPHPYERYFPDFKGGLRKAVEIFIPTNVQTYFGLDLSGVIGYNKISTP